MNVYVAGAWSDRFAVRDLAHQLRALTGCAITEPWWEKPPAVSGNDQFAYLRQCALDDLRGVRNADVLVFVHHEDTRGAWLEMGFALAFGVPVVVVAHPGTLRVSGSPFCHLVGVRVVTPDVAEIAQAVRAAFAEAA
jgi:hypothetical protein